MDISSFFSFFFTFNKGVGYISGAGDTKPSPDSVLISLVFLPIISKSPRRALYLSKPLEVRGLANPAPRKLKGGGGGRRRRGRSGKKSVGGVREDCGEQFRIVPRLFTPRPGRRRPGTRWRVFLSRCNRKLNRHQFWISFSASCRPG